jgi:hypothetical protein
VACRSSLARDDDRIASDRNPTDAVLPPEEQPEQVNTALLDFLKDWEG